MGFDSTLGLAGSQHWSPRTRKADFATRVLLSTRRQDLIRGRAIIAFMGPAMGKEDGGVEGEERAPGTHLLRKVFVRTQKS